MSSAAGRRRSPNRSPSASTVSATSSSESVGLTAGASTPEELVAAVLRSLASLGYDELEEVEVARENVSFRLPREVAAR